MSAKIQRDAAASVGATGQTKRPQLSLDELHQLKWLLGGVLTLLAVWTVFYMDVGGWTLMAITTVAAGACLAEPALPTRVPALAHTLAFPVIVLIFCGDLWLTAELLPAMVRLDIMLLLYRGISYRQRRDDLQVIVLGLFLIVVAGVLTVSLLFAAQILIYTACALAFLLTITLVEAADGGQRAPFQKGGAAPVWAAHANWPQLFRRLREVADWRVVALGGGLFAGVVVVSGLLFLAIPRFQLENSLFLERFISKKVKTGFNDTIKLGDVTDIQRDDGLALSVDLSDRTQVPAAPYWRMLVLDQYENGTFKLSAQLRQKLGRERTDSVVHGEARPRRGVATYWTFYLESGVSRYLPLLGEFELLKFREPQNFRLGADLSVVALRDEPVTMTAYRVEGITAAAALPDPNFAKLWQENDRAGPQRVILQTRLGVSGPDRVKLGRIASEIIGGPVAGAAAAGRLSAPEFAEQVSAWLRKNHAYSLSPSVPGGDGDPLVRWLDSHEPGHCELFAGAIVLLARTAGFPARVVTGFRGGSWNGYSNNFTIRNSDAHAWTEIFDAASGAWLRADALAATAAAQAAEAKGEAALASRLDRSWTARLESLRVFWYRRIVNFDQRSQAETLKAVKDATQHTGRRLREALASASQSLRAWLAGPWDAGRMLRVLTLVLAAGGVVWAAKNFRLWIYDLGWWRGPRREDPVRREAGRWLVRCRVPAERERGEASGVVRDLQRLRFGAAGSWPEPAKVFRRARQAWREARRRGRVSSSGLAEAVGRDGFSGRNIS
ncbi:MAG: DUF3488 domain-containing protein [Opitutus sp.]|nr:DUF3488 domain-containing protein [Opitutus sp.]